MFQKYRPATLTCDEFYIVLRSSVPKEGTTLLQEGHVFPTCQVTVVRFYQSSPLLSSPLLSSQRSSSSGQDLDKRSAWHEPKRQRRKETTERFFLPLLPEWIVLDYHNTLEWQDEIDDKSLQRLKKAQLMVWVLSYGGQGKEQCHMEGFETLSGAGTDRPYQFLLNQDRPTRKAHTHEAMEMHIHSGRQPRCLQEFRHLRSIIQHGLLPGGGNIAGTKQRNMNHFLSIDSLLLAHEHIRPTANVALVLSKATLETHRDIQFCLSKNGYFLTKSVSSPLLFSSLLSSPLLSSPLLSSCLLSSPLLSSFPLLLLLLLLLLSPPPSPPRQQVTASGRSQWAVPDLNCKCQIGVGTTGPQLQAPDRREHSRTSTASARAQWQPQTHNNTQPKSTQPQTQPQTRNHKHNHQHYHKHNHKHTITNANTATTI